eukprot:CAMPEP_0171135598 /NCGR_PEP_ID=MMETSP0766_2-20121228/130082_1 /TAXON_ID=439317 /ORGANISM="Gambierdiscus australes, Strain CAWD 149" /LENGTH=83 /DNA_ID=CAMNT_0011599107 /DNA_START=101 /DNA_END=349 /DNA_ORIENTATION=-
MTDGNVIKIRTHRIPAGLLNDGAQPGVVPRKPTLGLHLMGFQGLQHRGGHGRVSARVRFEVVRAGAGAKRPGSPPRLFLARQQ